MGEGKKGWATRGSEAEQKSKGHDGATHVKSCQASARHGRDLAQCVQEQLECQCGWSRERTEGKGKSRREALGGSLGCVK